MPYDNWKTSTLDTSEEEYLFEEICNLSDRDLFERLLNSHGQDIPSDIREEMQSYIFDYEINK